RVVRPAGQCRGQDQDTPRQKERPRQSLSVEHHFFPPHGTGRRRPNSAPAAHSEDGHDRSGSARLPVAKGGGPEAGAIRRLLGVRPRLGWRAVADNRSETAKALGARTESGSDHTGRHAHAPPPGGQGDRLPNQRRTVRVVSIGSPNATSYTL